MQDFKDVVTFQGNPLTLTGELVTVGQPAPAFSALKNDLSPVSLDDFKDKVLVVVSVPSLDTSVCSIETKRFNDEAKALGDDVDMLVLSMDLPFAQARWAGEHDVTAVTLASDHRDAAFGLAYGVLVKELRLLARACFVIDKKGTLTYSQIVPEMTDEPDYTAVLEAVRAVR